MVKSTIYPGPTTPIQGPVWADEIMARMKTDHRFANKMKKDVCWADLAVMSALSEPLRWSGAATQFGRVYLSSGTTGKSKRIHFSSRDWQELVLYRAHCLAALGVTRKSRAVVIVPFSPWFSGDNLGDALTNLGASVFCAGAYRPHLSSTLSIVHGLKADTLITLPSTAVALLQILEEGRRMGVLPQTSSLRRVILVGEPASFDLRTTLETALGVTTHMLFAASEAVIGHEDPVQPGRYLWNPHWVHLEVRRDDGVIDAVGEGELLVSRRWSEATPIVRYPLGDRVMLRPASKDQPGYFSYICRQGRACQLPTGVTVDFPMLERFLEMLRPSTKTLSVWAHHLEGGRTRLTLTLDRLPSGQSPDSLVEIFAALSLDVADVVASGFVSLRVLLDPTLGAAGGKAIQVRETGAW
ncbi:MAG: hypothetical protein HW380_2093 [Magnetococcales bacterium]|nr:hypothetical protein [Magnetococcales bacterium]HIJ84326.1 hypothetical protein [Magnetococcales bacterium]